MATKVFSSNNPHRVVLEFHSTFWDRICRWLYDIYFVLRIKIAFIEMTLLPCLRFGPIKLVYPRRFLLKCLYQAMKGSGHVLVCQGYRFCLFLLIFNYLYNQCLSLPTLRVRIPLSCGVLDTILCDKVCQWLATDRWFSPVLRFPPPNKTDRHDITEILLKVALSTINPQTEPFEEYKKPAIVKTFVMVNFSHYQEYQRQFSATAG